jgi:hypothetical protein
MLVDNRGFPKRCMHPKVLNLFILGNQFFTRCTTGEFIMRAKFIIGIVALTLAGIPFASATTITLADNNSHVLVDTQSADGMTVWNVDGVNHLAQQAFWYRVGNVNPESPVGTLTQTYVGASDGDGEPGNEQLVTRYSSNSFTLELTYLLNGGDLGSYVSDIAEIIKIKNTTTAPLDLHFFQYVNLDLMGTTHDDLLEISGGNTAYQTDGTMTVSETVVTPRPSLVQADYLPAILNLLNDSLPSNLTGNTVAGNGDLTWAFQWNTTIAAGKTFIISKDKNLVAVPEPAAFLLFASGGLVLLAFRRLRKR